MYIEASSSEIEIIMCSVCGGGQEVHEVQSNLGVEMLLIIDYICPRQQETIAV